MNEMIERVAKAIRDRGASCEYCPDPTHPGCCHYDSARAAIEAMREPTPAMNSASPLPYHWDHSTPPRRVLPLGYTTADAWRAMIDAILKED